MADFCTPLYIAERLGLKAIDHDAKEKASGERGRREPAPMVPPAKAQVIERETLQLGEFRFEAYGGWRNLGPDGPRSLWQSAPLSLDWT